MDIVKSMEEPKKIRLVQPDFSGEVLKDRSACRGILMRDGKILLIRFRVSGNYMIPGGGVEQGEKLRECLTREFAEETGILIAPGDEFLILDEYFGSMHFVNHYFHCQEAGGETRRKLTENEKKLGLSFEWVPFQEALTIFGSYETFRETKPEIAGLYHREFLALRAFSEE